MAAQQMSVDAPDATSLLGLFLLMPFFMRRDSMTVHHWSLSKACSSRKVLLQIFRENLPQSCRCLILIYQENHLQIHLIFGGWDAVTTWTNVCTAAAYEWTVHYKTALHALHVPHYACSTKQKINFYFVYDKNSRSWKMCTNIFYVLYSNVMKLLICWTKTIGLWNIPYAGKVCYLCESIRPASMASFWIMNI